MSRDMGTPRPRSAALADVRLAHRGEGAAAGEGERDDRASLGARILGEHFEFVWRSVRRMGVPEADVDDVVQQVLIIAARKLDAIAPGSLRAYLYGVAFRAVADARRAAKRRCKALHELSGEVGGPPRSASPEELMTRSQERALLDEVLDTLPEDVRAVFVLFELERLTTAEIAAMLGIAPGTAASRLRRGRELFQAEIARVKARRDRGRP